MSPTNLLNINNRKIISFLLFIVIVIGVAARFYHITDNQFIYYDEGMWLNHQRGFVTFIDNNPPKSFADWKKILEISMHLSLATGKALWSFFAMLRGVIVGSEGWYFTRLISAISGVLTLLVVFLFSKRFFSSGLLALLATALLATFPSHLFYSRVALQEGFSTLCFLLGMYFYFFPRKFNYRAFLSGLFFACVFFSNYRMIIIPFLMVFSELFVSFARREKPEYRKFVYTMLTFLSLVFLIGNFDNGQNTHVTFGWMFHQAHLADGDFDFINLLSYPYYIFKLESFIFGLLFFGNIYFIVKKQWTKLLPFFISLIMMILFSFAEEKGVRYLTAVMPFMVMGVASLIMTTLEQTSDIKVRSLIVLLVFMMFGWHGFKSYQILQFHTDYEQSMIDLKKEDKNVKVLSTQSNIHRLFTPSNSNIKEPPKDFKILLAYYFKGYQYLMIDPQAYISYTKDKQRFSDKLEGYLGFIHGNVPHMKEYPHFNQHLLERFALEHNVNLRKTIKFINDNKKNNYGSLKVYNLTKCIIAVKHFLNLQARSQNNQINLVN